MKDEVNVVSISVIEFDNGTGKKKESEAFPPNQSDYYTRLVNEAPFIYGDHGIQPANNTIDWLDEKLITRGQDFIRRNFFSIMLAHLVSLMLIFTFKSGRSVLLRTGESHKKDNSLTRYLSTILHIKLWYETDFITKVGKSSQDVYMVRRMHGAAADNFKKTITPAVYLDTKQEGLLNAFHEDCKNINTNETPWEVMVENPQVPMSQFDMVVTQFCFLGFINLYPKMFGVYGDDDEGMNGFVHLWAVLGRLLGIEDRFNLALHAKDRSGYNKIWSNIFLAGFKCLDKYTIVMWDSLIYGLRYYLPFLTLNSIAKFLITHVAKISPTKNMDGLMSGVDKFCYLLMRVSLFSLRIGPIRVILNNIVRLSIAYASRRYLKQGVHTTLPSKAKQLPSSQQTV